jgi:hypothetical protein
VSASYNPSSHAVTLVLGKYNAKQALSLTATGLKGPNGASAGTIVTNL